ncbi:conserved repeat domain-containing protein [Micromonospora rhizosphaerae]|uniref:Conserved repeat domain-containing protein n=1 Tax=Micromonospora rhizosphaerae TaxID=568872 RepID=A0A1C6RS99_9ACTN|nr:DUF11 domain-containing protein [Micromonospora rhizosphaerae]SCL20017.1 conserved repeat domain-containing protein [Micromonospora rhizosphaerae]
MSRPARTRLLSALLLGLVSVVIPAGPARAADPVDLFISDVSDRPDPVFAGSTVSYFVSVGNRGPGTATGVLLTAPLPVGVSFQSSGGDDRCSATSTAVTCDLGTMGAPGVTSPLIIQVTPTEAGTLSLTFTVSSDEPDADPSDNTRTATTTVTTPTEADVALQLNASAGPTYAGTQFFISAGAFNSGPAPATGVTARLLLPAGLSVLFGAACVPDRVGSVCTVGPMELPSPGGSIALIALTASAPGAYTISGSVTADQPDPQPANNSGAVTITALPAADLAVTVSESADPAVPGRPLTYTLTVTNRGPSPSVVHLTDEWSGTVAGGLKLLSLEPSQGGCGSPTAGRVECDLGTLASGATATVAVSLRPQGVGTVTNQVRVTGTEYDGEPTNNAASETTAVG